MNSGMKWFIGVIVVIVLIVIGVSLGNKSDDSEETGPIKIGFIGPLTGDASA